MTKLIDKALAAVRALPPESQDEIARTMLALAGAEAVPEPISEEDLVAVLEGLAQADRGEFANEEEVAAAFRAFKK
jgi:DNA-binding TFAR19-related protein (PDSD5 family)